MTKVLTDILISFFVIPCTFMNCNKRFASVGLMSWQIISKSNSMVKLKIKACLSSKTVEWATPKEFFNKLDEEFHFDLDPCSTHENAKCEKHYTIEEDGIFQDWGGHRVFCNPPYGREIPKWVRKCYYESRKPNTIVVMLIPARTDTSYFHDYIYGKAKDIRFIRGRLHFNDGKEDAPFPSMVVVF